MIFSPDRGPWRASKALLVAVDITGVVIPQYDDHPKLPVGLDELSSLARLTDHALTDESPGEAAFLAALEERGLATVAGDTPDPNRSNHEPRSLPTVSIGAACSTRRCSSYRTRCCFAAATDTSRV